MNVKKGGDCPRIFKARRNGNRILKSKGGNILFRKGYVLPSGYTLTDVDNFEKWIRTWVGNTHIQLHLEEPPYLRNRGLQWKMEIISRHECIVMQCFDAARMYFAEGLRDQEIKDYLMTKWSSLGLRPRTEGPKEFQMNLPFPNNSGI